jgi:hypothetical protein
MAKKAASQEDFEVLVGEVCRLEEIVLQIAQANRTLVLGLNNAWAILDRLTGRQPDLIHPPHVHTWSFVRPATFTDHENIARGEGVTEVCPCGEVRSRVTCWQSPEWFVA